MRTGFWRAAAVLAGLAGPVAAQDAQRNGAAFDDWRLACEATAVNRTICAITQRLTLTGTDAFLAEVRLQLVQVDGATRVLMAVTTPTDMALPVRPGYRVGEAGETRPLDWRTCTPQVCTASRVLDPAEVEDIRRGTRMILGYQPATQAGAIAFPVSLDGVTAGLAALEG